MNYKKIITAILLVSDGPVDHIYFEENFNISKAELVKIYTEINLDLKNNDFGFEINFNEIEADLGSLSTSDRKTWQPALHWFKAFVKSLPYCGEYSFASPEGVELNGSDKKDCSNDHQNET